MAGESVEGTNEDGSTFRSSTESRTEGAIARGKTKRLDLGVNVETHRQESLRTKAYTSAPASSPAVSCL